MRSFGLIALAAGLILGDGLLLFMAVLRETQEFWRNSGGVDPAFRDLVRVLFYPAFILMASAQAALCASLYHSRPRQPLSYLLAGVGVAVLLLVGAVTVANNLANLWNDRPLHWHAALEL